MPRDTPDADDPEITTKAAFDAALQRLLLAAVGNDVDPFGAWEYRNGPQAPDLEVIITELATEGAVE